MSQNYQQSPFNESYGPPQAAPPSYVQVVGGVPPSSPYVPNHALSPKGPRIVTTVVPVGPNRTHMICPHCHAEIDTTTKSTPGKKALISSAFLCLLGCCCGCCLIPLCMDNCMDVSHTCPNCAIYLGTFKR